MMEKLQSEIEKIVFEEVDLQSFSVEQKKEETEKTSEPKLGEVREYKEPEEKKEPVKHTCRETGEILTDPVDIEYYKIEQKEQIIENLLLGEFDADGKYVIDKSFLKELVKVKKVIREQFENKYILVSKLSEFGELKFTMQIGAVENGKKIAVLKFVEMSFNFDEDREVFRTYVASYKDDDDIYFLQKVNKVFNIVKKEEYDGKDIDPEELLSILNRFKTLYALKTKRIDGVDYISNTYVDEILAILKKYPCKFSAYILRKYNEFLIEMAGLEGNPKYFMKLRRFLDKLINSSKNSDVPKDLMEEIIKSRESYCNNYKNIIQPIMDPGGAVLNKQKPKTAVKTATKASGGGSKAKKGKVKKKGSPVKKAKPSTKKKTLGLDTLHLTHPYRPEQKIQPEKKKEPAPAPKKNNSDILKDLCRSAVTNIVKTVTILDAKDKIRESASEKALAGIAESTVVRAEAAVDPELTK